MFSFPLKMRDSAGGVKGFAGWLEIESCPLSIHRSRSRGIYGPFLIFSLSSPHLQGTCLETPRTRAAGSTSTRATPPPVAAISSPTARASTALFAAGIWRPEGPLFQVVFDDEAVTRGIRCLQDFLIILQDTTVTEAGLTAAARCRATRRFTFAGPGRKSLVRCESFPSSSSFQAVHGHCAIDNV